MILISKLIEKLESIPHKNRKEVMACIPWYLWPEEGLIQFFKDLAEKWKEIGKIAVDNNGCSFPPIAMGIRELIISQSVLLHLNII